MTEQSFQLLTQILTIVISIFTSVIITRSRNKAELKKIKVELEQNYAKSLFDKRVEIYPPLYNLLSGYGKKIQYHQQTKENLREFRESIDNWNSQYSIFFTNATRKISYRFRKFLQALLLEPDLIIIVDEDWEAIHKIMLVFEDSLRSEIGILDTKPAGEIKDIEKVYSFIEEKINTKGISFNEIKMNPERF